MSDSSLTFATQGGEFSYHAQAARTLVDGDVAILECSRFGEVVRASRSTEPGLGMIAICTAKGTVDKSAAEIVRARPSALPTIVGRVDEEVSLVLMAKEQPNFSGDVKNSRVICHAQQEAWVQCEDVVRAMFSRVKYSSDGESTRAIRNMLSTEGGIHVAIGPEHAAKPLGAEIISGQLNPKGSTTRFYALQRDPRLLLFAQDPAKTVNRSVISLAHPEGQGEMEKVIELIQRLGIVVGDFITFAAGDFTKHRNDQKRAGGLFEFETDRYDEELLELCARINGLKGNDGADGPFSAKILGGFPWYQAVPMDIDSFVASYDGQPSVAAGS